MRVHDGLVVDVAAGTGKLTRMLADARPFVGDSLALLHRFYHTKRPFLRLAARSGRRLVRHIEARSTPGRRRVPGRPRPEALPGPASRGRRRRSRARAARAAHTQASALT